MQLRKHSRQKLLITSSRHDRIFDLIGITSENVSESHENSSDLSLFSPNKLRPVNGNLFIMGERESSSKSWRFQSPGGEQKFSLILLYAITVIVKRKMISPSIITKGKLTVDSVLG